MKMAHTSTLTLIFIGIQVFFLFFYIHHTSALIQRSYQRQKYEHRKLELANKQRDLKHALHATHSLSRIKEFAVQAQMQKITLEQIKTVPHENPTT